MRALIALPVVGIAVVLAGVFASGLDRVIVQWALDGQRAAQDGMAQGLQALRAGDRAALAGFLTVCFAYGFFHAAGPGHGKLLIAGYGVARSVGAYRLAAVALASSLAQAFCAIALVALGLWVLALGRSRLTDLAEHVLTPLSFAAIAAIGAWLVWRGTRAFWAGAAPGAAPGGAPGAAADMTLPLDQPVAHVAAASPGSTASCSACGHAHGPDPLRLAAVAGWRDLAAVIGAVAIRPCTGALFVLILTAHFGLFGLGVAGTLAMALGTAAVTIAVALAAVTLRGGVLAGLGAYPAMARIPPMIEIAAGTLVAVLAGQLAWASL